MFLWPQRFYWERSCWREDGLPREQEMARHLGVSPASCEDTFYVISKSHTEFINLLKEPVGNVLLWVFFLGGGEISLYFQG